CGLLSIASGADLVDAPIFPRVTCGRDITPVKSGVARAALVFEEALHAHDQLGASAVSAAHSWSSRARSSNRSRTIAIRAAEHTAFFCRNVLGGKGKCVATL